MKFNAAFITLAVVVASATAAPTTLEERKFGMSTIKGGLSSAGQSISNGASKAGSAVGDAASAVGKGYNNNAATWNAGAGAAAGAAGLAAQGIVAQTNEDKENAPAQKRKWGFGSSSKGGSKGSSTSTPDVPSGAAGAAGASTADKIGSGTQAIGLAAGGLGIWNANEGLQQQQDAENQQQQRRSPLGPAAGPAAEVGLMALGMGGGPSFSSSHSTGQSTGNGNVHVSGASKRDTLFPRLLSFDDSSTTSQSTGNGNVHVSGASSGGGGASSGSALLGDHDRAAGVLSQVAQSQQAQQKQQKRLFSMSHEDHTTQTTGNGNVHVSGATSGGELATPAGMASLNPGTAGQA